MKWLVSLLLITVSCGIEAECDSEWFKAAGLNICDNDLGISADEIEYAVDVLEQDISSRPRYIYVRGLKKTFRDNDVEVIFTDERIATKCEEIDTDVYYCDDFASGVNTDRVRMYVNYDDCLGLTSFEHELMHSIEYFYLDIKNAIDHDTPEFFVKAAKTPEEVRSTIEYTTMMTLIDNLDRCDME